MSFYQKMVDTATGASPPWTSTREMASSPINFFNVSIQTSGSDESGCPSMSINKEKSDLQDINVMNAMKNKQPTLPYPSPLSGGSLNSTPILSSLSLAKPVPLMSIGSNDRSGFSSNHDPSTVARNINYKPGKGRHWPVDPPAQYGFKHRRQRTRAARRYQPHHYHQQCFCRRCTSGSQVTTSGKGTQWNSSV